MAASEYVSVHSQADTEEAELALERTKLKQDNKGERQALTAIYVARGLEPPRFREFPMKNVKSQAALVLMIVSSAVGLPQGPDKARTTVSGTPITVTIEAGRAAPKPGCNAKIDGCPPGAWTTARHIWNEHDGATASFALTVR